MKYRIKIKQEQNVRLALLQELNIEPGLSKDGKVCTIEITDIPDGVPSSKVLELADRTLFWGASWDGAGRYSYKYAEMGDGGRLVE